MEYGPCNRDVYARVESLGLHVMSKGEAESYCKQMAKETDYHYDWYFVAGRVHIFRLKKES